MPSLAQRKLVGRKIKAEYDRWRRKLGREPSHAERKQIVAIGFVKARRRGPRANPLDLMSGLQIATGIAGVVNAMKNPGKAKANPFILVDSANDTVLGIYKGSMLSHKPWERAASFARRLGRNVHVVAHPYVPAGWGRGTQVSKMFYFGGPVNSVTPEGKTVQMNPKSYRGKMNPKAMYEVVFRQHRDSWHSGPFHSHRAATEHAKRYLAGLRQGEGARYEILKYGEGWGGKPKQNPLLQTVMGVNPGGRLSKIRIGERVQVTRGGVDDRKIGTVVRPFPWREESGAYRPPPSGSLYVRLDSGEKITVHRYGLKKVGEPDLRAGVNPRRKRSRKSRWLAREAGAGVVRGAGAGLGTLLAVPALKWAGSKVGMNPRGRRNPGVVRAYAQWTREWKQRGGDAVAVAQGITNRLRMSVPDASELIRMVKWHLGRTAAANPLNRKEVAKIMNAARWMRQQADQMEKVGTHPRNASFMAGKATGYAQVGAFHAGKSAERQALHALDLFAKGPDVSATRARPNPRKSSAHKISKNAESYWSVTRDGKELKRFRDQGGAGQYLHDICPASWDHCVRHEGYDIKKINGGQVVDSLSASMKADPSRLGVKKNPGKPKTRTVTLQQFWNEAVRTRNKPLCAEIQKKFGGYEKWTHGTKAKRVKLEYIPHPTLRGTMVTYDAGRQPEALYKMANGHQRDSSLWKHKWETQPTLHHDPEAGIIITKLRGKSKITDFYHR